MSSPIERFLERLRAAESRNQRELVLTLMEARDLHSDITRLLLRLETAAAEPEVVTLELKGQDF